MKQLSDIDIRISWAQAWNLAVAVCAEQFGTAIRPEDSQKEMLKKWQAYFYDELTRGYIQKFAPQEIHGKSPAERSEIVADEFGSDAENLI